MSDKHIDDIIKDALQDMSVPYESTSWDALKDQLDRVEGDAAFDEHIHHQMHNMHAAYTPGLWDSMQKRLDIELSDEVFDDSIKSKLTDVDVAYRHKSWLQLKEWLDYQWFAANKVYVSKSAEAILMLLALFTFFNYNTGLVEPIQPKTIIAQNEELTDPEQNTAQSSFIPFNANTNANGSTSSDQSGITDPKKASDGQSIVMSDIDAENDNQIQSAITDQNEIKSLKTNHHEKAGVALVRVVTNGAQNLTGEGTHTREQKHREKSTLMPLSSEINYIETGRRGLENLNFNPLQPIKPKKQKPKRGLVYAEKEDLNSGRLTANINTLKSSFVTLNGGSSGMAAAKNLPLLELSNLLIDDNADLEMLVAANDIHIKFPEDKKWAISTFLDLDFNQISTPYDQLYQKNGYNQNRIGAGGGLLVHRDLGPVEVSTGVGYSSKQYNPKEFIELAKKNPESEGTAYRFNGIKLNVLTIPVHAAYYITKKGNWRPYIVGGGAVQLALQAEYEKEAERVPSAIPVPQFLDENEGATVTYGQPNFEKKKFPDGLLGDGTFKENHYFTLDIGVGIERKLTPSTSFFVQPTVYYNLFNKGLSANNDKINTFSLQVGTKTRI